MDGFSKFFMLLLFSIVEKELHVHMTLNEFNITVKL